ncbi:Uncharacterized conserved protein, DUF427 family [Actinopolyspora mzabensis]|uniref:Uncharacterized conserved protein, DUF427 family n=1 Tax=Actinopolyspora mzabensis TaxID=995066 RepID=A0A1G8WYR8_ACTMZ|nr:DUF427 domain-containing protein [Actinopolyspora mzabensis]SDJ83361.1 Uncharacterized conserved protein, DUF427 family [Actinopolyspora mzabensis]
MALTLGGGPLTSRPPETVNYRIEGPAHRLLWQDFPRRVRARFAGETVLDSSRGKLLHESNLLPQLYVPVEDVRAELLEPSTRHTHCPFKGDAEYRSVRVGDWVAESAVWGYPAPLEEASWLAGHLSVSWGAMDQWLDEEEEVLGHLRDPYHRVDVRKTARHVRVSSGGVVLAESARARLLSETGLPNRFYLPAEDVRTELLETSATTTVCPYKGTATYRSVRGEGLDLPDAVFRYEEPLPESAGITGLYCFLVDGVTTTVDGAAVA